MKFPAKHGGGDYTPVPAGTHSAICTAVVDLGLQPGSVMYPDPRHQVYLRWELPDEQISYEKDGARITGPMTIGRTFTASMGQKANLRKFVEGWRGKAFADDDAAGAFDLTTLLGTRCLLNVTHTEKGEKTYANVMSASPLPKSMQSTASQTNESLCFSLDAPNETTYQKLPGWLREKIANRIMPTAAPPPAAAPADPFNDDIPF